MAFQFPHSHAGTNPARQAIGLPGHCKACAAVGHIVAHPAQGCSDVGCFVTHDAEQPDVHAGVVADVLARIQARIDRAFADDADKWESDKSLALQDIERIITGE
jgi:hypothetical protein